MLIVVGLGGNALLRRGQPLEADVQRDNVERAACAIAELAADHQVVVTHGNGPQVGLLALQSEAYERVRTYPLDVLGAESEGMIGYLLEQALANALPDRDVATLLTQVVVAPDDPAFGNPTKPVGPVCSEAEATRLVSERGWAVARDGERWRRVVASPEPLDFVELRTIDLLVEAGILVVCAGGGGVPVVLDAHGALHGVEAVIDKDRSAALLAELLAADALLLLTDVPAVCVDWATPEVKAVRRTTPDALGAMTFPAGSMGPKVEAACRFARHTGAIAGIGALDDALAILRGEAGTRISNDSGEPELEPLDRVTAAAPDRGAPLSG